MTQTIPHPAPGEYAEWYSGYVASVAGSDLMQVLEQQVDRVRTRLGALEAARGGYRYAEGKWSVKEVLNHLSDSERVFSYRLLRIARGDETPLAGFDEKVYAVASEADQRTMESLLEEFAAVRSATLALIRSLPASAWGRKGTASGWPVSARALGAIIPGHVEHHLRVLGERYGV